MSSVTGRCAGRTRSPRRRTRCGTPSSQGLPRLVPGGEFRSVVHRYYDPGTGQFLSVDPLANITGTPYAYTGGDPVNGSDPAGLMIKGPSGETCMNAAACVLQGSGTQG